MQITCGKCHRPLRDPRSVERGFGPDCWASIQAEEKEHKKPLDPADESEQTDRAEIRTARKAQKKTAYEESGPLTTKSISNIF